ncbi:MAG: DUF2794 domain-containing protein [Rhodospirillales bacterium]
MGETLNIAEHRRRSSWCSFSRGELKRILNLYSRRVASGEWRDYAIDNDEQTAAFSVFRRSFERPIFTITKRRQPRGSEIGFVLMSRGQRLAESRYIDEVVELLERRPRPVV